MPSTICFLIKKYSCFSSFAVYPNPGDEELNVELVDEASTTDSTASLAITETSNEFSIELYNDLQEKVRTGKSVNQKLKIDIRNLLKGNITYIYFIRKKL